MPQNQIAVMSVTELAKLIGSIGKRKVALEQSVQLAAVQCIAQSIVHRNATPAMQLFEVCENSVRREALVAMFEMFGNLCWSKVEKRVIFFDVEKIKGAKLDWTDDYAKRVASTMWYSTKKEAVPKSSFDIQEEASRFLDRIKKLCNKGAGVEVKHAELYDVLTLAYNRFVFEKANSKATEQELAVDETAQRTADHAAALAENASLATPEELAELKEHFGTANVKAA